MMDLAVKYCLKKISYRTSEQEKTPKATKRYEKNEMKKGKNNTRRLKQCSLSFNSMQT